MMRAEEVRELERIEQERKKAQKAEEKKIYLEQLAKEKEIGETEARTYLEEEFERDIKEAIKNRASEIILKNERGLYMLSALRDLLRPLGFSAYLEAHTPSNFEGYPTGETNYSLRIKWNDN